VKRLRLGLVCSLLTLVGCGLPPARPVPPSPESVPQLQLGQPTATPRQGAPGAPVDCTVSLTNRSGRPLESAVLACELLDSDGVPLGTGLTSVQGLRDGQTRTIRTVIYGVRIFDSARAYLSSADLR
jgi:hypothetical protein